MKRVVLMVSDASLLALSIWLSFSLRLGELYSPPDWSFFALLASFPVLGILTFHRFGLYRMVTRFVGPEGIRRILYALTAAICVWALIVFLVRLPGIFPRSSLLIVWIIGGLLIIGSRQFFASQLSTAALAVSGDNRRDDGEKKSVIIYGAGSAGDLLARELAPRKEYNIVAFVDSDASIWGQKIRGIKVRKPEELSALIHDRQVQEILLAIPSAEHRQKREILKSLENYSVAVKTVPNVAEIASGQVAVSDVRPIRVEDLLGRDPVPPNRDLLAQDIRDQTVLITGAGGSIGSELARQVLRIGPKRLVLLDLSEVALYDIDMAVRELQEKIADLDGRSNNCEIETVLGSVNDDALIRKIISNFDVSTIYHAAAYKHVPIVEHNPVAGLANNTFGTLSVVKAARDLGVSRFVLISTDKAVRPTNIMGASKRLAELVLQANASRPGTKTVFTMVRFGNVLASSGSVVRRFTKQIESGGPVTVTHPEIVRYFMSIPEAAQLVIQAGAMASGGDVFVLDMGEPVKINELAKSMIQLSGLRVDDGTGGDIEIAYTGLRPGEKLYEELLIGENVTKTDHPRIMRSNEPYIEHNKLSEHFETLKLAMKDDEADKIRNLLCDLVDGYQPSALLTEN